MYSLAVEDNRRAGNKLFNEINVAKEKRSFLWLISICIV